MRAKVRLLRIKRDLARYEQTTEITDFLHWTSVEELWFVTPVIATMLPESIKADYSLIGSQEGLHVLYDGCEDAIIPMLERLFARWKLAEPAQVAQVLEECTQFLLHQRSQ